MLTKIIALAGAVVLSTYLYRKYKLYKRRQSNKMRIMELAGVHEKIRDPLLTDRTMEVKPEEPKYWWQSYEGFESIKNSLRKHPEIKDEMEKKQKENIIKYMKGDEEVPLTLSPQAKEQYVKILDIELLEK